MKKTSLVSILTLFVLLVIGGLTMAQPPAARNFITHLSGDEEVPPVDTLAQGQALFRLNKDDTELHYRLIIANIEGVTQAHIHCGAVGVNGPVVVFLFGFDPEGVTLNGILATGTITPDDVIPRPDSAECPDGVADLDELLAKMRSGDTYVNVHTLAFPGGEIRGQIRVAGPKDD
jgi:hypothetical protein